MKDLVCESQLFVSSETDPSPSAQDRPLVQVMPDDLRARVRHVRQDATGPEEDIILDNCPGVNGDVVLDLDIAADHNPAADENVLAEDAVRADGRVFHDVAKVPDLGPRADPAGLIHIRRLVHEIVLFAAPGDSFRCVCRSR